MTRPLTLVAYPTEGEPLPLCEGGCDLEALEETVRMMRADRDWFRESHYRLAHDDRRGHHRNLVAPVEARCPRCGDFVNDLDLNLQRCGACARELRA